MTRCTKRPIVLAAAFALAAALALPAGAQGLQPAEGGTPGAPPAGWQPPQGGGDTGGGGEKKPPEFIASEPPKTGTPPATGGGEAPAATGNILANSPEAIRDAMQAAGYQAVLEADSSGDPLIRSKISKSPIWIFFLNCNREDGCRALRFHTGYKMDRQVTLEEMNSFMQSYAYARAFLSEEGNPRVQMDVLMRADGVGPENFRHTLNLWRELVELFEQHLKL
ncbi:hypothetical protein ATO6_06850 [Oceanicola sp. 22II-s10i]|uniref:YbjN domain-containing protein n=1 Tax=Oceanicola sp. 22II-s10i TaxID=1317116 RepID=UPI000B521195|nr:YbjN domain-containing protein [Oceanicola sp. 22II-s10i]OWU86512.1 hypothetical protein ATO6_06850 [Oceanicola sp. 22II-s10i]